MKIKKLEWIGYDDAFSNHQLSAQIGEYTFTIIKDYEHKMFEYCGSIDSGCNALFKGYATTIKEAKKKCQAHFEHHIKILYGE